SLKRRRRSHLAVETMEERCLLSGSPLTYSVTGTGNNLLHPNWGSVGQDLLRTAPAQYADGVSALAGANRPSPRQISDVIVTDPTVADALRTHSGGRLKTSPGADGVIGTADDLLPFNNQTYFPGIHLDPNDPNAAFAIANDAHLVADSQLFMAGDKRANENIELTSVHTLFAREHNRIADMLHKAFPNADDETIFQIPRSIVIAEVQSITFNEFLPAL